MKYFRLLTIMFLLFAPIYSKAQSFSAEDLNKIKDINTNIADVVIKSALGFKDMRGAVRQKTAETVVYDATAIAGLHAQQYFITDAVGAIRSIYMGYYTDVNDIALVTAAVLAEPAFAGEKWTLKPLPGKIEGESNIEIRLGGLKVGNLNLRSKTKEAVLSLGFFETPGTALNTPAPVKEEPHVTAKCASGNCQSGKGELVVFDKKGILTDRLEGEFGGGQFIKGTHYMYGNGLTPSSFEKDEGKFSDFLLTDGTVTLSGYGIKDSVFSTALFTRAGNCISGNCVNGNGKFLQMQQTFSRSTIMIYEGKFKDGAFLEGTAFMEGVDTLFDGSYTIKDFHYRNRHNQAFADAVFIPKGYTEEIKGTWFDHANGFQPVPFFLSDDYHRKEGRFIMELKYKNIPRWILDVYVPVSNARGQIAQQAERERAQQALEYDMKIHPNDYKTNETYSGDGSHTCSCCNGTGSVGSGQTFMGREIPKRCGCCGGTGKRY